jgi:hypothetical protein
MSNTVNLRCTNIQAPRIDARMAELITASPGYAHQGHEAVEDLIHHGWMLTRLPADEIATIVARANEIISG